MINTRPCSLVNSEYSAVEKTAYELRLSGSSDLPGNSSPARAKVSVCVRCVCVCVCVSECVFMRAILVEPLCFATIFLGGSY